jgi:nucleotide-binding universal stress UspA family protein
MERIVVGVDGSEASLAALRWALDEARRRSADVDVVHAWSFPTLAMMPTPMSPPTFATTDIAAEAKAIVAGACESVDTDGVVVRPVIREGPAAASLLDEARGADLLVVGSRGRGGFAGLVLGSVSRQCAEHSPCPIVIVRDGTTG